MCMSGSDLCIRFAFISRGKDWLKAKLLELRLMFSKRKSRFCCWSEKVKTALFRLMRWILISRGFCACWLLIGWFTGVLSLAAVCWFLVLLLAAWLLSTRETWPVWSCPSEKALFWLKLLLIKSSQFRGSVYVSPLPLMQLNLRRGLSTTTSNFFDIPV